MSKRALTQKAPALAQAALRQQRAGKLGVAVELYQQAIGAGGESAALLCNLGEACRKLGQLQRAVDVLTRAAKLEPLLAPVHYNLGLTLDQQGEIETALHAYAVALELEPELPELLAYYVEGLREQGKWELAIAAYARFVPFVTDSVRLRRAVASALLDLFRVDEALVHLRAALALGLPPAELYADLAAAHLERGEAELAIAELRRALSLDDSLWRAHASLVYLLPFSPETKPQEILDEAKRFDARHAVPLPRLSGHRVQGQRLRVGYVSPDFREHPTALFVGELLLHHDRSVVEVFCYSSVQRPDQTTARLLSLADEQRDISRMSDEAAAAQIFADGIDVLVDLAMHTGQSRPLLFARKPAPIQACWLAYPGTTGLSSIDYRLTDRFLDPPEGLQAYSEESVYLESYWCYAPPASDPAPTPLPALRQGFPTFGSLHSFKKVSPAALELWAQVLVALSEARFVLVAPAGESSARVLSTFESLGVSRSRIELVRHAPRSQYLETFHGIDCCFDTWPYAGGTSSLDAFWMGVPVVTLVGPTALGRAGQCIAGHLELPELVAHSAPAFVEQACALVADLPQLAQLRAGLRARMQASALMNGPQFARNMESALRRMARP